MFKRFISDTKKYNLYSITATRAQLKAEVANSYLNWIWWILEPLCFTFIYYLVFGFVFNLKEDYLIPFLLIGVSVWDFFNHMCNNCVRIMRQNKPIVSRIYLPKYVLIYVRLGVNGFKMLITFGIAAIAIIIMQVRITWRIIIVIPVLLMLIMFTFGISCILLHFGVFIDDLGNIVRIVLKMFFYVTGVFYNVAKRIPEPYGRILCNVNPVAYVINTLRNVVLYGKVTNMWVLLGWLFISGGLCILGISLIYKNENSYVKSI